MAEDTAGDLLDWPVIVHQLNCLTVKPHGLAEAVARAYPWADVYGERPPAGRRNLTTEPAEPGTIQVRAGLDRTVVGILGQWDFGRPGPGYPGRPKTWADTAGARFEWFVSGLEHLERWVDRHQPATVAFPHQIGCGLAGGSWPRYRRAIDEFAARVRARVVVVRLDR